jgi:hypothetical protein
LGRITPLRNAWLGAPSLALDHYDGVEVSAVRYEGNERKHIERCGAGEAEFWSVYLHLKIGGVECVADLPTKDEAMAAGRLCIEQLRRAGSLVHKTICICE